MDDFDIPIFRKSYDLYKAFYSYRTLIPKQDRYTIWQRAESLTLDIIEYILLASHAAKADKLPLLEKTSAKLNLLWVFLRLMKEVKALDNKKYTAIQEIVDEMGRMLGGWIRSTKER